MNAGLTGGWRQAVAEDFSPADAIGGPRGMAESVGPTLLFVVVYTPTGSLRYAAAAAAAVGVLAGLARLVRRDSLQQVVAGLIGVGLCCAWALYSGHAENFFALGLLTNLVYALVLAASLLIDRPLLGVVVALWKRARGWRARRDFLVASRWATAAWVILHCARLAVQAPLWLGGRVAWLGTARLAMGVPLFLAAAYVTWALMREPTRALGAAAPAGTDGGADTVR